MNQIFTKIREEYTIAIQNYLAVYNSQIKQVAYEIGSYTLANGLGVAEIITIHQQALEKILANTQTTQNITNQNLTEIIKQTTDFLAMALQAFEIKNQPNSQKIFNIINEKSESNENGKHKLFHQNFNNLASRQARLIVDLEDSNNNQATTNKNNEQLLYEWNTQTNRITWENYTEKNLGYSTTEMPKNLEELIELIEPQQQETVIQGIKQAIAHKTPIQLQYQMRRQDGTYIFIEHKGEFFRDSDGNLSRLVGLLENISDRKLAEAKIHFQSRLLDSVQQAVVATDLQGKIIYWNHFAEILFGWSVGEVLGCQVSEIISTLTTIKVSEMISRITNGESWSGEMIIQRRDQKLLPIMEIDSPIYNQEGELIGISSIIVDLTERKQMESALRQSEERFQVAIKNSPITVFHQDTDLRYTWISNAPPEFSNSTIVGKQDSDLFAPAEAENLINLKRQALEQKKGQRQEISVTINGAIRYYDMTLEPLKNEIGEIIGITGACYDITDRKQAISALQKADRRLRLHVENSPLAVIEWNQEFRIQRWSGQAEQIFGWQPEEAIGKRISELRLIHEADLAEVNQALNNLLDGSIPHNLCRNRNYTKNGKVVYCQWYNSAVVDESDKVVSILSFTEDISAQKQAEKQRDLLFQQLEQQNQNLEYQIKFRTAQLAAELVERQQAETTLKNLIEGTAAFTGKDFFPVLVEHLASALGVSHAIISARRDNKLNTLAFWSNNQLQPNTSYDISDTPCEIAINQGVYHCHYRVQQRFPKDHKLVAMQAESYLGVALFDRAGQTIGNLCIINNAPLTDVIRLQGILKVFAARAVAELERR